MVQHTAAEHNGKLLSPAPIAGLREAPMPFQRKDDAVSDQRSGNAQRASASGQHSSPGQLTEKAARLVQAGLPWPGEKEIEHEVRKMVVEHGVPWSLNTVRKCARTMQLMLHRIFPAAMLRRASRRLRLSDRK